MFETFFEKRLIQDPGWQVWANGGDPPNGSNTASGESVSSDSALKLLAVFSSISFISDLIGQLPTDHYRKINGRKSEVTPKASWLDRPNVETNGQDFQTEFTASLLWAGNTHEAIARDRFGQVAERWIFDPARVFSYREYAGAPVTHLVDGQPYKGEIKHTRGFTLPGQIMGCNPITYARETIGSGLAQATSGASFYGNGSIPSMVISTQQGPEMVDADALKKGVQKYHQGAKQSHGTLVLTGGATATAMNISPADAQFLEGRNFTATELVTALYRIPPDLLGYIISGTSLTYQNLQDRWTDLRRRCLGTWITKYERAASDLTPRPQFVKLNDSAFLRADEITQYKTIAMGIQNRFLLPDEGRDYLDLPPLPGGDSFPEPVEPATKIGVTK